MQYHNLLMNYRHVTTTSRGENVGGSTPFGKSNDRRVVVESTDAPQDDGFVRLSAPATGLGIQRLGKEFGPKPIPALPVVDAVVPIGALGPRAPLPVEDGEVGAHTCLTAPSRGR